jgi:hypothetical protein
MDETHTPTDFSGVWQSKYTYHSSSRDEDAENVHYVRILQEGQALVVESLPELSKSYLLARFYLDDQIVTGSWEESTNPDGPYKGAKYHGAAQLILSEDGKSMEGKWVGFGKQMEVKTGPWTITYVAPTADGLTKPE